MGRGGGQGVSVLALYSNDPSSNPAEANSYRYRYRYVKNKGQSRPLYVDFRFLQSKCRWCARDSNLALQMDPLCYDCPDVCSFSARYIQSRYRDYKIRFLYSATPKITMIFLVNIFVCGQRPKDLVNIIIIWVFLALLVLDTSLIFVWTTLLV